MLKDDVLRHIQFTLGSDPLRADRFSGYMGLAHAVRDRLVDRWIRTERSLSETLTKRVYFLSLEFLPGRLLKNYLNSIGMTQEAREAVDELGFDLEELEDEEPDPGLGNGGLGRLASCFMDSMACTRLPGYGYGIRYDYGMFSQSIEDGHQRERSDNWMSRGNPWEIQRRDRMQAIRFFGRSESYVDAKGEVRRRWVGGELVLAMPCDILIPGFANDYVSNMRLWAAQSSSELSLEHFSQGDYVGAVEAKVLSESISKVLYPNDELESGKELRLKQQYFFVAATMRDIIRTYKEQNESFDSFPDSVAIQLNDTHPAIGIPELMRVLIDEEDLGWSEAWSLCQRTFAYTNHTVLPEALETWPIALMERLLPRHVEIIHEINRRFLEVAREHYANQPEVLAALSIVQGGSVPRVRMAHLAIVGSHSVNGVAEIHSRILKERIFPEFNRIFPERITNVTNGITPRRWLHQANPALAQLISSAIGTDWIRDLDQLEKLVPLADDSNFRTMWMETRKKNKQALARYVLRELGFGVDPGTLFDVHVKRIHEYKRQLLNVLHVIALYNRIKADPASVAAPRTVIFAGKAAPGYRQAKRIIKLITSVADLINHDSDLRGRLRVVFLPNYSVSQSEKVIPAADLSEQISTAGMEASGTGNMKMALNGALTIGTFDGANIEIMEAVGRENAFMFGLTAEEVVAARENDYAPRRYYEKDAELRTVMDMIASGAFSPQDLHMFEPLVNSLLDGGDYFMVLADFRAYLGAQEEASRLFMQPDEWARRSILNTARIGEFSSDRSVREYASRIWQTHPLAVKASEPKKRVAAKAAKAGR